MIDKVVYDPIKDKVPSGVVKSNEPLRFKIKISKEYKINKVNLVLHYKKITLTRYIEMKLVSQDKDYYVYSCNQVRLLNVGLYWYHFEIISDKGTLLIKMNNRYLGDLDGQEEFPLTVIKKEIPGNKEYQGGIIYHIFVDRFNKEGEVSPRAGFVFRSDWGGTITKNTTDRTLLNYEVFGGNLKGIIAKLDYLKSIGVTTIYLSPIFMAPSNHKYDTSDYERIDPMFGDLEIFKELVDKAKEKQIGIILDGVFNHIGSDSIYFNKENHFDSLGAYNSKKSPYYHWFNFDNWPDEYRCWWNIKTLPSVNQENKDLQNYICKIIKHYMNLGISGFRLDVVDEIQHNFLTKICHSIYDCKKDAIIIGEVWEDASTKVSYGKRRGYFLGEELNSVMNYPLKDALIEYVSNGSCDKFYYTYQMIENNYPDFVKHNLMNIIGSHDTRRILSILKENANAITRLKIITGLQYTFYGLPSIFYGDEVGIEEDPPDFCRKCFPWGKENQEILDWYRVLKKVREYSAFKDGKMELVKCDDGVIVFKRIKKDAEALIVANLSEDEYVYHDEFDYLSLINSKLVNEVKVEKESIDILIKKVS